MPPVTVELRIPTAFALALMLACSSSRAGSGPPGTSSAGRGGAIAGAGGGGAPEAGGSGAGGTSGATGIAGAVGRAGAGGSASLDPNPPFDTVICDEPTCGGLEPVVVSVCPQSDPACTPVRETTVVPRIDGRTINHLFLPINGQDVSVTLVSGPAVMVGTSVNAASSAIHVRSDAEVTLSYYDVAPQWGGTTPIDFVSATFGSPELVTTVYRHPTFLVAGEPAELHARARHTVVAESALAGIDLGRLRAVFIPSELVGSGEGNWSEGALGVSINYGNPPYIQAIGTVYDVAMPRFAHEVVHELFGRISSSYPGNFDCLNEGIADAFAFAAGFLPEGDFGPIGVRGTDFGAGCSAITGSAFEIHDAGNCPFWQVRRLGKLTSSFAAAILHPQHVLSFDSCDLASTQTGNSLVVLFSEAEGSDMSAAVTMAAIPNAGSYDAAKAALGL